MSDRVILLVLLVGAVLILNGCRGPLDVAAATSNAAAVTLTDTRARLIKARKAEQRQAAARVGGDRNDPAVKAQKLDRAAAVGARYRSAFEAYDLALDAWTALAVAIHVARELDAAGGEVDAGELAAMVQKLTGALRELVAAADHVAGVLGAPDGGLFDGR